jgi:cell division protein FtsL
MNDKSIVRINNQVNHERDLRVWWRCVLGVVGGILVAAGFAFAAQHHFSAVQFSAQNVELQRERERLKTERKRLLLERETVASPAQLEKMARNIGLQNVSVRQINNFGETANEVLIENTEAKKSFTTAAAAGRRGEKLKSDSISDRPGATSVF